MQEKLKKEKEQSQHSGLHKVLNLFGVNKKNNNNNNGAKKVNKADIGVPIPVSEEAKKELTKQWMQNFAPQLAQVRYQDKTIVYKWYLVVN